jgi:hypothetical protein
MPRLLGVEIPADKRIEASLTYIYGIGLSTAKRILEQTNIDPNLRAKNLTPPGGARQPEAFAGDQFLSRDSSPARLACARPADVDKCPDTQRPPQNRGRHP